MKKIVIYAKQEIELGDEITYGTFPAFGRDVALTGIFASRLPFPHRTRQDPMSVRICEMSWLSELTNGGMLQFLGNDVRYFSLCGLAYSSIFPLALDI